MPALAYRLRIRDAADLTDDLVVTSLDVLSLDGEVAEFTDNFEGYADTPALLAAWTLAPGDQVGSTLSLDSTGGVGGGKCAKLVGVAGPTSGLHRGSVAELLVTGLEPLTAYVLRGKIKTDFDPVTGYAFGEGPVAFGTTTGVPTHIQDPDFGTFKTIEAAGTTNGAGELTVLWGWGPHNGLSATRTIWFDDFGVSGPGIIPNYPFIAEPPQGDGQTLNPITGEVQTGGFTVNVIDALIATDTRVVTAKLADDDGRNQLLSRRAYIEETEDGGETWPVLMAGYVNSVRMPTAIRFEFTIGESRRVEQTTKVFEVIEDGFDRVSCIIGGPVIGGFGPYPDVARPIFEVIDVTDDLVTLEWITGHLHYPFAETGPPVRENVVNYLNGLGNNYAQFQASGLAAGPFPGLVARLMDVNTAPGVTSNPPAGLTTDTQDFTPWTSPLSGFQAFRGVTHLISFDGTIRIVWPLSGPTQPAPGDRFKLTVFPRHIDARNPLHWTGHPVDLATGLLALRGMTYNAASAASVKSELGDLEIEIRPTGPMTLSEALEKIVYGPFGIGARTNEAGELEFFTTRRDFVPPVDTLTNDELTTDDGIAWATEEGSAVNRVVFKTHAFSQLGPAFVSEEIGHTDDAIDFLAVSDVTVEAVPDESETAVFGAQTITYEIPGNIVGLATGTVDEPGTLDVFVALIGAELFDFQGRGAITSELSVRRGVTDALIGETVTVDCAHIPTASPAQSPTSQRGTVPRIALVLRRTPTPSGPVLKLQDRGVAPTEQVGIVPTFTIVKSDADPRKIATVAITNGVALAAAGVKVRVQMATGSSTPTSGASVRLLDPATDPLTFDLPPVCAGSKVWARMRAELTGFIPGDWSGFAGVQLDALDPPTSLTGTFIGRTIHLSWVRGDNAEDIPVEVLLRETGDPDYVSIAFLPPGTLDYALTVPLADTEYDIGVRHHEAPPFDCVSSTTTLSATSGAEEDTVEPPPDDSTPPPPVTGVPDAGGGHFQLPFHATLTHGAVDRYPPAELAEIETYGRRRLDCSGFARCRVLIHVRHPLPVGAKVGVQYVPASNTEPAEEDWVFLNGTDGPLVDADVATQIPAVSPVQALALEARQDIVMRPVTIGGDGATQFDTLSMFVEFQGTQLDGDDDSTVEDPCQETTDHFGGYEDTADLEEMWPLFDENIVDLDVTWSLDKTGGVGGTAALKVSAPPGSKRSGSVFHSARISLIEGLDPGRRYTVECDVKTNWASASGTDGRPHLGLSTNPGPGAGSAVASDAANGAFEHLTFPVPPALGVFPSAGGELWLVLTLSNGAQSEERITWFDNVTLRADDSTVVNPCNGGPTLPGDGGFTPPDVPGDPPPPPTPGSQILGLWNYKAPFAYPPFYGTVHACDPDTIEDFLEEARDAGIMFVAKVVGSSESKSGGVFSQSAYLASLEPYAAIDFSSYTDVLAGVMVIDEPYHSDWGVPGGIQMAVVDGVLCKRASQIFDGYPIFVRASAWRWKRSGIIPHYATHSWNQFPGPNQGSERYATVQEYMAAQKTWSAELGLGYVLGGNAEVGGPGKTHITPTTIRRDYIPMAADTGSLGLFIWANNPPLSFLQGAPYVAAFEDVIAAMPT